jgi:menaquinone-dependent protoporphyrinogen oxidase
MSGMTVLVTAATKHGSTAEIAQTISAALTDRGVPAVVLPPEEVGDISLYEAVVLGSAVYSGHWLAAALALVDRSADTWAGRPVWLFSSGPIGKPDRSLTRKMGADPVDLSHVRAVTGAREHRMFAGKLVKEDVGLVQRLGLTLFGMQGDFRDWNAIRTWSVGIADALRAAPTR